MTAFCPSLWPPLDEVGLPSVGSGRNAPASQEVIPASLSPMTMRVEKGSEAPWDSGPAAVLPDAVGQELDAGIVRRQRPPEDESPCCPAARTRRGRSPAAGRRDPAGVERHEEGFVLERTPPRRHAVEAARPMIAISRFS